MKKRMPMFAAMLWFGTAVDPANCGDVQQIANEVAVDALMTEPARSLASAAARHSVAYSYRFSYVTEAPRDRWTMGSPHGAELAYVFDTVTAYYGPATSTKDEEVGKMVNAYWANFAKRGNPNSAGLPQWSPYTTTEDQIMEFRLNGTAAAVPDPWKARLDLTAAVAETAR